MTELLTETRLREIAHVTEHPQSLKMFPRAGRFCESTGIGLSRIAMGNLMVLSEWHRKMARR